MVYIQATTPYDNWQMITLLSGYQLLLLYKWNTVFYQSMYYDHNYYNCQHGKHYNVKVRSYYLRAVTISGDQPFDTVVSHYVL